MGTKINYDLLEKARVMLFAAHGYAVKSKRTKDTQWCITHPIWDWDLFTYRIAPDALRVPEGYELVPLGEAVSEPCRFLKPNSGKWYDLSGDPNKDPRFFIARPIAKPEPRKVPLTKTDWDGHPVWWLRNPELQHEYIILEIAPNHILTTVTKIKYDRLLGDSWQRSHDRINWTPCYKLEERP
jgi:hypothetical protein